MAGFYKKCRFLFILFLESSNLPWLFGGGERETRPTYGSGETEAGPICSNSPYRTSGSCLISPRSLLSPTSSTLPSSSSSSSSCQVLISLSLSFTCLDVFPASPCPVSPPPMPFQGFLLLFLFSAHHCPAAEGKEGREDGGTR